MIIFPILALMGIAAQLMKFGIAPLASPMVGISIIIFIEYIFSIFNMLNISKFILIPAGIIFLVQALLRIKKNYFTTQNTKLVLPYLLYLLPFFVLINAIGPDYQLTKWDEFSFWGTSVKYMQLTNELYSFAPLDLVNAKQYPPAQQLFQYFFIQFTSWSEPLLLGLELVLILCTLMSIFSAIPRNVVIGGLTFISSTAIIYYFHYQFHNIYADTFLAFYFAATAMLLLNSKNRLIDNLSIFIAIFVLVQIKVTGLIFATTLIPIILIKAIASQAKYHGGVFILKPIWYTSKVNQGTYSIFAALVHIFTIFISYLSWVFFLKVLGIQSNPKSPSIIKYFEEPLAQKMISATHIFLIRLSENCFTLPIKLYQLILFLGIAGLVLSIIGAPRAKKFRDCFIFLTLPASCLFYLFFLLYSYITFFSEFEGSQLYGIERYSATFFIGWILIILGNMVGNYLENKVIKVSAIIFCLTILFIYPPKNFYHLVSKFTLDNKDLDTRKSINRLSQNISELPPGNKFYFISQGSNGFESRIFQYTILPRPTSSGKCSSFGKAYHPEDIYTCNTDLSEAIADFDFLVVHYGDKQFWDIAGKMLTTDSAQRQSGIYKIVKSSNGIRLSEHF